MQLDGSRPFHVRGQRDNAPDRSRAGAGRRALLAAAALALALPFEAAAQTPAPAQQQSTQQEPGVAAANYLVPFPENDVWHALVVGDSMADGLLGGLTDAFSTDPRLQLQKKYKTVGSLVRNDVEEEVRGLEDAIGRERTEVVIVMLGLNDRGGIRAQNGRRAAVGSDEWRAQYGARIDRIVKMFRRHNIAVYWVGLPIMRRQDINDDVEALNSIYRERVGANGGRFIDIYAPSADESGVYSERGPDIAGKPAKLRDPDGVSFTPAGFRKVAFFVERELKRDMATARDERTIPLAGNEAEQRKIASNPPASDKPGTPRTGADGRTPVQSARTSPQALAGPSQSVAAGPRADSKDQRPDNSRVAFKTAVAGGREELVTIDILRPALPEAVIALVTRKDTGDKASVVGDSITDTLSNGLMVMRSVTPSGIDSAARTSRGAPAQQPFFRALVKGERLPFKPGRADDFRWPREDDVPPPPAEGGKPAITGPAALKPQPRGRGRS